MPSPRSGGSLRTSSISARPTASRPSPLAARRVLAPANGDLIDELDALLAALRAATSDADSGQSAILVIEDDLLSARLVERALTGPGRKVLVAGSVAQAEEALRENDVALILLDLILPDQDGRQLLVRLRERPRTAGTPVFVMSAKLGSQPKTECFALGADAYFEKPLDLEAVSAAVAGRLQRSGLMTDEARRDSLTGLPNRAGFYDVFDRMRAMAVRQGYPLALGMLDLDHLKWVNDTWGHPMGDEVLRRVAVIVSMSLRDSDLVARWGGEEFVVLFFNTDLRGAEAACTKSLERVRSEVFLGTGNREFQVTFSAGLVEVFDGMPVDDLISQADRLLYLAKSAGRNQVVAGDDGEIVPPRKRIMLAEADPYIAAAVQRRLAREGFEVLHYPDGAAAFEAAQSQSVALVISDVDMPRMDGFELLRRLRRLASYARTPIVMLTSMGSEEDIVRAFEIGADDYILKPFSSPELIARVRRLIMTH